MANSLAITLIMQAVELSKLTFFGGTVESVRVQKDELVLEEGRVMKTRGSNMIRVAAAAPSANKVFDVVEEMPQFAGGSGSDAGQFLDKVQVVRSTQRDRLLLSCLGERQQWQRSHQIYPAGKRDYLEVHGIR